MRDGPAASPLAAWGSAIRAEHLRMKAAAYVFQKLSGHGRAPW